MSGKAAACLALVLFVAGGQAGSVLAADAADGASATPVLDAVQQTIDSLRTQITDHISNFSNAVQTEVQQAVGTGALAADTAFSPLTLITDGAVGSLNAVRKAYESQIAARLGLALDGTTELRKQLQDGNFVIDQIRTLRGATCSQPSFTAPEAVPARITGQGGSLTISGLACQLRRVVSPLQANYVLACTQPALAYAYNAANYKSRFNAAASAETQECKVQRRYGVESTTTITLFDPAAIYNRTRIGSGIFGGLFGGSSAGGSSGLLGGLLGGGDGTSIGRTFDGPLGSVSVSGGVSAGNGSSSGSSSGATSGNVIVDNIVDKAVAGAQALLPGHIKRQLLAQLKGISKTLALKYTPRDKMSELASKAQSLTDLLKSVYEVKSEYATHYADIAASNAGHGLGEVNGQTFLSRLSSNLHNVSDIYSGVFAKAMAKVVGKKEGADAEPLLHPLRSLLQSVRAQGASADLKLGGDTSPLFSTEAIADAIKTSIGAGISLAKSGIAGAAATGDLKSAAGAAAETHSSVADALASAITAGVVSGSTSGSPAGAAGAAVDSKLGPLQAALAAHAQQADAQLKQLSGVLASSLASWKDHQPGQLLQGVMDKMSAMG